MVKDIGMDVSRITDLCNIILPYLLNNPDSVKDVSALARRFELIPEQMELILRVLRNLKKIPEGE